MASTWSVFAVLFVAVFCTNALILEDDPLVDKVKAIVAKIDAYLSSQGYDELSLPDVGSNSLLKLRNGGFGVFSTLYVQNASNINETKQEDDSILYSFDITVGLSQLVVHYDFDFSAVVVKESGNFSLSVQTNSAEVSATAVVQSDGTCQAELTSLDLLVLSGYNLTIYPDNIPGLEVISKAILNLITPLLLPSLNKSLQSALALAGFQEQFSALACSELA